MSVSVAQSLAREERVCGLVIHDMEEKCTEYEKKYNMSSEKFYSAFTKVGLGDELDYFKWKALIEGIREWENTQVALKELKV
ncbi:MAG: hypothetical protein QME42_06830 [bacterium]|nr:hypothetical protein [bacterium]